MSRAGVKNPDRTSGRPQPRARQAWVDTREVADILGISLASARARLRSVPSRLRVLKFEGKKVVRRVAPIEVLAMFVFAPGSPRFTQARRAAEAALTKWAHSAALHAARSRRWRLRTGRQRPEEPT